MPLDEVDSWVCSGLIESKVDEGAIAFSSCGDETSGGVEAEAGGAVGSMGLSSSWGDTSIGVNDGIGGAEESTG